MLHAHVTISSATGSQPLPKPASALHQSFTHPDNLAQHGIFVEDNKVTMFAFLLKLFLKDDQFIFCYFPGVNLWRTLVTGMLEK
jgi:hypothetical protein